MPKASYGPKVKERIRRLLSALLTYVQDAWENPEFRPLSHLKFNWRDWDSDQPKLQIETKLRVLQILINRDADLEKLTKPQIAEAIKRLEDFLDVLEDNRLQTQGKEDWKFTLILWSKDLDRNLERFEQEWERRRPEQSRTVLGEQETDLDAIEEKALLENQRGMESYWDDRPREARAKFKQALKRCNDLPEARYNLGCLHEQVWDFDRARLEYREAMLGGFPPAYSNMARLYIILDENYAAAVELSKKGLKLTRPDEVQMKYALLKNLGWARFKQSRLAEAKEALQDAIRLENNDRAAVHCLLAQVLDAEGNSQEAQAEWQLCRDRARDDRPDEDEWLAMARQRLADLNES